MYDELYQEWALDKKGASVTAGAPAADQITSIQATAVANFYGYKVGTVDITYAAGTDLTGVTADSYTLYDGASYPSSARWSTPAPLWMGTWSP